MIAQVSEGLSQLHMILSLGPLWRTRSAEFPCLERARDPAANDQEWVVIMTCDPPLPRWLCTSRFPFRSVNLCTQERAAARRTIKVCVQDRTAET